MHSENTVLTLLSNSREHVVNQETNVYSTHTCTQINICIQEECVRRVMVVVRMELLFLTSPSGCDGDALTV